MTPSTPDPSRARILVLEDDRSVVGFLEHLLRAEDYDVSVAGDGLQGLLKLRFERPDLALVDVMMPDVDGLRVLHQLLEEGDGALPVPVVVITGSPEGAARCRELLDPDDVLLKPFEPDQLLARIQARLATHLASQEQP